MWYLIAFIVGLQAPNNHGMPMALGSMNDTAGPYVSKEACLNRWLGLKKDPQVLAYLLSTGAPPGKLKFFAKCYKQGEPNVGT